MALPDWAKKWRYPATMEIASYSKWPHEVKPYTGDEAYEYTADPYWQQFRKGMENMPTSQKLAVLDAYRYNRLNNDGTLDRDNEVQVDNYIDVLKRDGYLNTNLEVLK